MRECVDVLNTIECTESMYIYGAGDVAEQVAYCLLNPPYSKIIKAFLVSKVDDKTKKDIYGIPVMAVDDFHEAAGVLIVVAVLEKYRDEILSSLSARGYTNTVCFTFESDATASLRRRTFAEEQKNGYFDSVAYLPDVCVEKKDKVDFNQFQIYVAKHHKDRELLSTIPEQPWEIDIQVGAALTEERIATVVDNEGASISEKNPHYCELTALYWIWKHTTSEYVGLSHYRRRFDLSEGEIAYMMDEGIDILATIPLLNVPSVGYMYKRNHIAEDWARLESAIRDMSSEYEKAFRELSDGNYYFAYNMCVMKRECLNSYCEWLFPILAACEKTGIVRDAYQNRYIGFLAERLLGVYMLKHRDDYKMAYTDKCFYE